MKTQLVKLTYEAEDRARIEDFLAQFQVQIATQCEGFELDLVGGQVPGPPFPVSKYLAAFVGTDPREYFEGFPEDQFGDLHELILRLPPSQFADLSPEGALVATALALWFQVTRAFLTAKEGCRVTVGPGPPTNTTEAMFCKLSDVMPHVLSAAGTLMAMRLDQEEDE